jgi:MFS family permease
VLSSLFVYYVANNAVWAHFDRIGAAMNLSKQSIGFALSAGQMLSLVGAAAAAALSTRIPVRRAIVIGNVVIGLSTLALLRVVDAQYLLASVAFFIGSIGFVVPFYLASLAADDASGRRVMMGKLAIMAGLVAGPALAAAIVTATSLQAMIVCATVLFGLALVLATAGLQRA